MLGSRKFTIILVLLFVLTAAKSIVTFTKSASQSAKKEQHETNADYRLQFPVVDYEAPEPATADERAARRAKGARHDGRKLVSKDSSPRISESATFYEGPQQQPVPSDQSTIIIVGTVLDARAFLSNDKENVYSEFTFSIDEVLKKQLPDSIVVSNTIVGNREGGIVRYINGHERLYRVLGQGVPVLGKHYLVFLKAAPNGCDYDILTAYELRESDVLPIDYSKQFEQYKGFDKTTFLKAVRDALAKR